MKTVMYLLPFTAALSLQLFQMQMAFGKSSKTVRRNDLHRYQMKHFLMLLPLAPAMTCLLAIRFLAEYTEFPQTEPLQTGVSIHRSWEIRTRHFQSRLVQTALHSAVTTCLSTI